MGDLLRRERKTRRMTTGRACALVGLAAILAASARPAVAIDPDALAAVGLCAEEDRELKRQSPVSSATVPLAARGVLRPTDVAAPPPARTPRPGIGPVVSPGPCDSPGSGCQGPVLPAVPATPPPRSIEPESPRACELPGCGLPEPTRGVSDGGPR